MYPMSGVGCSSVGGQPVESWGVDQSYVTAACIQQHLTTACSVEIYNSCMYMYIDCIIYDTINSLAVNSK